jgi:A/G-specific adenine glycosylase
MKSISRDEVETFRSDLTVWAEGNLREFPWRNSDTSFYKVFIAEFLLSKTQAQNVDQIYHIFINRYPDLRTISEASQQEVEGLIQPLGLQRKKSEALKEIARNHNELPRDRERLIELPQVGPYVADASLCIASGESLPLLDSNVERIMGRLLGERWPNTYDEKMSLLGRFVPEDEPKTYNLALLDFGAKICKPNPLCEDCFASEYCAYFRNKDSDSI